ncbi:DNA polymerase III subunit delta [Nocardioides marmorisolisilvae]|uniref:DNA polymerase III subunit delta n=1 Tax=Nocardioides marmorisolisilvae TaxID=1542737 RepID=A0A3N0DTY1_9ACTN|nr:DNA polymerase III subunit delta [Nocardioides marmorisolisilvae]RNL78853.1 DNA polymerase III subunit delta [Nocardioides marmorisolisilvae]
MATPDPSQVLGRVTLVTGPEEFLAERTVQAVRAAVRKADPEAEFSETSADLLTMATLGELAAPSLFSSTRCVVVRSFEDLPEESVAGLLDYVGSPAEDVALVLVHGGGQKGSGVLTKLRKEGAVTEVKSVPLKPSEFTGFVVNELRQLKVKIDGEAAAFLVQAVGQDLRSLAAAASQLAGDFAGQPITTAMVKTYFGGRAEAKSFAVADHAIAGQAAKALEELRWALDRGTAPVLITSAVAGGLRSLARFKSAPRGMRDNDLMREVGVPAWKLRTLRDQSRGWDDSGLARAIRLVATADAEIKGQAHDAAYSLEKMVLEIVRARPARTN